MGGEYETKNTTSQQHTRHINYIDIREASTCKMGGVGQGVGSAQLVRQALTSQITVKASEITRY